MAENRTVTIKGHEFNIRQPFDEGHVCTAGEAKALNQLWAENIRNNMAKKVESGEADQAAITEYDNGYAFTLATVSASRKLDPVEREARALAKATIRNQLAAAGRKLTDVPEGMTKEQWEERLEAAVESVSQQEQIVKLAKDTVNKRAKLAESTSIDLGLGDSAAAA